MQFPSLGLGGGGGGGVRGEGSERTKGPGTKLF